ncbi:hypothetical protein AVEN_209842-1 [Araneus ventricosus]|uniref:Uncharacterized protein n=1 Tax=Araneus ventricosus TaxID=182803 RepID=A0A4Y2DN61_ARAVE|nr:hypothetical protein AVEN_37426-1 [Araneus ventricosus]GBM17617.1 hypothetical protein AVEN_89919-1 [Araneus ventricosus]GBM17639.1 hypothetical protein AVEN_209842-1 [Araneus ventricosus]
MRYHKEALLQTEPYNDITRYKLLAISPHIRHRHRCICRTVKSTSRNHPGKNLCPASEESSSQHVAPLHLSLSFQDHQRLGGMGGQLYPRYHVHLNDVEASQLTRNEKKFKVSHST